MIQIALFLIVILALWAISRGFKTAAEIEDSSQLSKSQIKQSIAYARMIVKNNADEQKREEAAATIVKLEAELARRAN